MPCSRLASFSIPGIRLYASLSSSDRKSHYDILGLSPTSTALQIKQKYFELAKLYHPDRNRNKSAGQKQEAIKKYTRIKEAYEVLGNKERREQFDLELQQNHGPGASSDMKNSRTSRDRKYYGQSQYTGAHYAASSLHRRARSQTYHYYNKSHEFADKKDPGTAQKDSNPLNQGYKSGSNYDVPHFDFDKHYKQQRSYELHRKKQSAKKSQQRDPTMEWQTERNNKAYSDELQFSRPPRQIITLTTGGIIVLLTGGVSFLYFISKIVF